MFSVRTSLSGRPGQTPREEQAQRGSRFRLFLERLEDRRLMTAGFLDPTFGSVPEMPGRVVSDFGGVDIIQSVALQRDGKIVVAGHTDNGPPGSFLLARYNSDGSLDDGGPKDSTPGDRFGSDGKVVTSFGGDAGAFSVIVQPDGKIVAAGYASASLGYSNFALVRYNADGSLDDAGPTDSTQGDQFGSGGAVVTDFGGGSRIAGLSLEADGRIVAAGNANNGDGTTSFALARYNADGSLDDGGPSDSTPGDRFGSGGKVVTAFADSSEAQSVATLADGGIVAAGYAGGDFAIARYLPNGSRDADFNGDGRVTTDFGGGDFANSVVLQPDGKIVAAGSSYVGTNINVALALQPGRQPRPGLWLWR